MVRRILMAVLMAVFCSQTATVAAQETEQIEGIVAIVNDDPISFSDVRQRARMLLLSLGGQEPSPEQIQQLTSQALDQLIDEKLQLQEAAEYEVQVSDDEIAMSLERMAQQSGLTKDGLMQTMVGAGVNPASLEDQTRADIAWRRIMNGLYGSRIRISDNQINDQLRRLKTASQKTTYQLSEIFLFAPADTERQQALVAANSIRQQIEAGAPFQAAAQRFSSAPTAATGGDMGWVTLDDLDETRAGVISGFDRPGLSDPIEVDDGIYLMLVRNKNEPAEPTSRVDLTRISVVDGSEDALLAALNQIGDCGVIDQVVDNDDNLRAVDLEGILLDDLGEEGRELVGSTAVNDHTEIFAQSGTLAAMFVCARDDGADKLPRPDQIEDELYSQQLSMISQRSLRNLRREATIIRR